MASVREWGAQAISTGIIFAVPGPDAEPTAHVPALPPPVSFSPGGCLDVYVWKGEALN